MHNVVCVASNNSGFVCVYFRSHITSGYFIYVLYLLLIPFTRSLSSFHSVVTLVSCLLPEPKHVFVRALQQDQRRGRPGPPLHLLRGWGALGDLSRCRPGAVRGWGSLLGASDGCGRARQIF